MKAENRLKADRQALWALLEESGGGNRRMSFEKRYSRVVDRYFQNRLEEILQSLTAAKARKLTAGTALLAVGGYGRGELCPHSDIDILIVCKGAVKPEAIDLAQPLFMPLWDMGCDLGHGFRSIKDCLALAGQDLSVLVSYMDLRHVAGDEAVTELLKERVDKLLVKKRAKLVEWLEDKCAARANRFGDAGAMLEPHLKEGAGGLRDSQTVLWLDTLFSLQPGVRGAPTLSGGEKAELAAHTRFLLEARSRLHSVSGRRNDTVFMELQPRIALLTGHVEDESPQGMGEGVERFLADLHAAMTFIKNLSESVGREALRCLKAAGKRNKGSGADQETLAPGIILSGGELDLAPGNAGALSPGTVMELFRQQALRGAPLSRAARQALGAVLDVLSGDAGPTGDQIAELILDILGSGRAADCLSFMQQCGVLGVLLPEFGRVQERVQFDDFHTYPVGRHTLETIRNLEQLETLALAGDQEQVRQSGRDGQFVTIWQEEVESGDGDRQRARTILLLAALFHDLGKDEGGHEQRGEELAVHVLKRWGIAESDGSMAEEIGFLVRRHLLLARTAVSRDLNDESVVVELAGICSTASRLRKLYLLTYADAKATGPRAWSDWTAHLLAELFDKTLNILEGRTLFVPHLAERSLVTRDKVREMSLEVAEGWLTVDRVEELLEVMPARYTMERAPEDILRHVRLVERFEREYSEEIKRQVKGRAAKGFTLCEPRVKGQGIWEAVFVGKRTKGLFAAIAGVLSLHGFDIFSGDSFIWSNGVMVAEFNVSDPPDPLFAEEAWTRVRGAVKYAMIGKLSLYDRLRDKQRSLLKSGRAIPGADTVQVNVDNTITDFYTVIEVLATDRRGLLYDIAHELNHEGAEIHQARVATHPDHVSDLFYVRDNTGGKILDPDSIQAIRQGLRRRLANPVDRETEI